MIANIIEYSVCNRLLVLLLTAVITALGTWSAYNIRLDAIPDLSDVQVIVVTEYPGQNPEVVENQVTYPLASALLAVPGATDVRGFSMFELSFVYVLFEDGTDIYWARSRVLEYLNFARDRLPTGLEPKLGPDATGVGWVYQYVLFPGYYCPDHPRGIWRDSEEDRWYGSFDDAPQDRQRRLTRVRAFENPGVCPLTGEPLLSSNQDLASLRSLQDWYLRYPLTSVPGVSEVAAIGGFVRQYQVLLDPQKLQAHNLPLRDVIMAIERSNNDVGGSVIELSENEYMVRSRAYLKGLDDLGAVVAHIDEGGAGTPVLLRDVASLQIGGEARRGIGELDGLGEAVGGVIVCRFGENAYKVIQDAKAKLAELENGLPPGVFIKPTYDRSALINRAVGTLRLSVIEEIAVVGLVCLVFLMHVRSAFVTVFVLPVGLLISILIMQLLGINANIMSLGGLALAVGVMVDSSIVMVENVHKHLERASPALQRGKESTHGSDVQHSDAPAIQRFDICIAAAKEVGPSLFFSLLIITVSFLPIFVLGEQSGRLFKPLAYTKTFAMAAAALLSITVIPVLMAYLIRGRIPREERNPLNRFLMAAYEPAFRTVMRHPVITIVITVLLGLSALYPATRLGSEFMPALDEGDLLYMPTTDPSISVTKSKELLQQTDKLIKTFPEVVSVHGKIGRAETATDPAPLSMIETVVHLNTDANQWRTRPVGYFFSKWPTWLKWPLVNSFWPERRRITTEELIFGWIDPDGTAHAGLNEVVQIPGLANAWPYPIENRINMLSTGIKTPVGIKIMGSDLQMLSDLAEQTAAAVRTIDGTISAYPDRTFGGYYLDIDIDRKAAARYGLTTGDVQDVIQTAIGGMNISTTVEGLERYPLNVRYARELRDDIPALQRILVPVNNAPGDMAMSRSGASNATASSSVMQVPLGQLATFSINPGPPMIRSENAQRTAWVFVDIAGRDLGGYVKEAKRIVEQRVSLPTGYTLVWSGRFEYLQKANERLLIVVPITIAIIIVLLYMANQSWFRVGVVLLAVPFSLIGALWLLWALDYNMSLAVWVGIIGLLGLDAETGQVMLLYLDSAYKRAVEQGRMRTREDLYRAVHEGAVKRIRPKAMTAGTTLIGLMPLLWATGTGAEVTRRIVAPLVGGITVSFIMELLIYPVIFYLAKRHAMASK
jgi:Cu(I)/Ag(I) efflux system membrane protein CusA/SilA